MLLRLIAVCVGFTAIWSVSISPAQDKKKEDPAVESAAPSIDKDEKIQAARERFQKEESAANRGPRFFDLAVRNLGPAAQRKPPIPEKAVFRYLGAPDLFTYTGAKNADGTWLEKNTSYAYAVDNKNNRTVAKKKIAAGEKITVIVTIRDGNLVGIGFNDGEIKESPGFWQKYKK